MKKILLSLILIVVLIFTGCNADEVKYEDYPPLIKFNNQRYIESSKYKLDKDDIEKEIGKIEKRVEGIPENNGESNEYNEGTKIYKIKNIDIEDNIAVYFKNSYIKYEKSHSSN